MSSSNTDLAGLHGAKLDAVVHGDGQAPSRKHKAQHHHDQIADVQRERVLAVEEGRVAGVLAEVEEVVDDSRGVGAVEVDSRWVDAHPLTEEGCEMQGFNQGKRRQEQ